MKWLLRGTLGIVLSLMAMATSALTHAQSGQGTGTTFSGAAVTITAALQGWHISEDVSPNPIQWTVANAAPTKAPLGVVTATWSITVTPAGIFTGQTCATNTGSFPTEGLAIVVTAASTPKGTNIGSTNVDVSSNPVLDPGETGCYNYTVYTDLGALQCGQNYKVTADWSITNHNGQSTGTQASTSVTLNCGTLNAIDVHSDLANHTWTGITGTTTETFTTTYSCGPGETDTDHSQIVGFSPPQTATATLTVLDSYCPTASLLARSHVTRTGNTLLFKWQLAIKTGILGFNVRAGSQKLNNRLIRVHTGRSYQYRAPYHAGPYTLQIVRKNGTVSSQHIG